MAANSILSSITTLFAPQVEEYQAQAKQAAIAVSVWGIIVVVELAAALILLSRIAQKR